METPSEDEHYRELQRQNMRVLVIVVLLIVFGAWLVDAWKKQIKLEECFESGQRNCLPADKK